MKRALLVVWGLAILALCTAPAFAGSIDINDQITLEPGAGTFVFKGNGSGGFSLNLTNVLGPAVGIGTLTSSGRYSINQNGVTITGSGGCGAGCFNLSQTGDLIFKYGSTATNGSLLVGDLQLMNLTQTPSTKSGVFNEALVVDLTITGGSLASKFPGGTGILQITLKFTSTQNLSTLLNGQTLTAALHTGSVNPLTLPEPGSLALFGSGLLGLGGLVRMFKLKVAG